MLLRHSLSKPRGAGVPDTEIYQQINKLNRALGDPHFTPPPPPPPGSHRPKTYHGSVYTPQLPIDERDEALERITEFLKGGNE